MYEAIPNVPLVATLPLSQLCLAINLGTYHDVCAYVWALPYGRTSTPDDWSLVIKENRGTCSSKHGFLKILADELSLKVELVIGIYAMSESNTPGVGSVLNKAHFDYIPEAHCYLRHEGKRIDLTRQVVADAEPITEFFSETSVTPDELATQKTTIHRSFIEKHWGPNKLEEVWSVREGCIAALAGHIDRDKQSLREQQLSKDA